MSAHDIIADHLTFALRLVAKQESPLLAYLIEMAILENNNPSDVTASLETEMASVSGGRAGQYICPDAVEGDMMLS
ncbi:hypothetical protein C0075_12040 [Rhizobium sp. KAs_5_22]|uniref:hypothetical protein n=1 Tax=Ciceribacter selenitireducens TaxID=448181 RepID=UPI000491FBB0|nr:hypothetical protein [Ciceribacter selenitireducens]PPJ46406.1 hypothetical protein C0075_12040 [Rhizobium sp. KAs_5_22]